MTLFRIWPTRNSKPKSPHRQQKYCIIHTYDLLYSLQLWNMVSCWFWPKQEISSIDWSVSTGLLQLIQNHYTVEGLHYNVPKRLQRLFFKELWYQSMNFELQTVCYNFVCGRLYFWVLSTFSFYICKVNKLNTQTVVNLWWKFNMSQLWIWW